MQARCLLAPVVAALAAAPAPASTPPSTVVETVAISGETAPGTGGAEYAGFGAPVVNEAGQLAFTATLQGAGVDGSNDLALFSGSPLAPSLVARRGGSAPGAGGAGFDEIVSPPVLNDAGRTAFRAFLQLGAGVTPASDEGLWSETAGGLALVAREGDPASGVPAGQVHASALSAPRFAGADLVAYHGSLLGGGTTTASHRALWMGSSASPSLVARRGDLAPGAGPLRFGHFDHEVLTGAAGLAFRATLDDGSDGLWLADGGLSAVARAGDAAPGVAGASFASLGVPVRNEAGRLAFTARLAPGAGVTSANDAGLWAGDPGSLALVAREGDAAPGGGTFESFHGLASDAAGDTAFRALTSVGSGIYVAGGAPLAALAVTGAAVPGTPAGTTFAALLDPVRNDDGQVAFAAFLQGPGTTSDDDEALFAQDADGSLRLVVREGALFERRAGDAAAIDEIALVAGPRSLGRSIHADGDGALAFQMRFADGGEGVFLLPEPAGTLPLVSGALLLALLAAPRRRAGARALVAASLVAALALPLHAGADAIEAENADRCDFLDTAHCLLPWPSDHFTTADGTTETGLRLNLNALSMPSNIGNVPIQPGDYNRNDGWSPGQMILTSVPGIDLQASGAPLITDLGRSLHPDSATVIVNATTGERHLHWAELDFHATSDATRLLILRPGVNLEEDQRYVVAIQGALDARGMPIPPSPVFEAYRDAVPTTNADVEARRARMEENFEALARAGVDRGDLFLAWDFTVASERNLSERVLHMRDDAFAELGSDSPEFSVTQVTDEFSSDIYRHVEGVYLVPRYVNTPTTGARMTFQNLQGQGPELPDRHLPDQQATFQCIIPRSATADGNDPVAPARPSLLGHGLLGDAGQVTAGHVQAMANEHNFVFCATEWIGMSTPDLAAIFGTIIPDLSNFGTIPERGQQSFLNFLYLARLMIHADGFASDPAFQAGALAESVIDPSEVYYDGNSQGGIMGGGLMAVAQDITRGVLGVPAMNYSTLLRRSVDFAPFKQVLDQNYSDEIERSLILSLIQILWDRGEANAYAHHMTDDPLPNTPPHEVLLHEAFGDHQVANVATEVEARTIGAELYVPAMNPGRHTDLYPLDGIPGIAAFPHPGSALVVWDSVPLRRPVEPPPVENRPPDESEDNQDPHSDPRSDADGRDQKAHFLSPPSGVIDVCGGGPCLADGM